IITAFVLLMCSVSAQDVEDTLMIYGRNRFYKTHLPLGYTFQKQYPVVFVFHGGLGNPDLIEKQTGFSKKADEEGFIVVYPYGTGSFDKKLLTWNTWDCCGYADKKNINDVDFIDAVIKKIKLKYSVDEKRFYATGLSNGGMMCYLLACELPDKFAAVAPVAATMFDTVSCNPKSEVSLIIFNSADDQHIPYNGGVGEKSLVDVEKLPVETVVNLWKNKYNCFLMNKSDSSAFQKTSYKNNNETEIVFYKMLGGGHSWPGGENIRRFGDAPVNTVSATNLIWEFFNNISGK
ncbi:MAG: prolyl oligopeptidase family serine peptidase, partial [Ignavibacterium sp.]|nr:prolyl oligopeptidase family serine peptidase [Ignavibacterium sp.]